jgi:hypothetical protein
MGKLLPLLSLIVFFCSGAGVAIAHNNEPHNVNLCTERGGGDEAELFGTVHSFIGTLGKPLCFQFLRWHFKDALVDVPMKQHVKSIDVIKQDPHSGWSNSTRLARCRAFYPDHFKFLKQVGFVRYYTSPRGRYTVELGVDSCHMQAAQ